MAAPQLAADEIAEASEAQSDRHQRRDEIDRVEEIELVAPRPEPADAASTPSRPPWNDMPPSQTRNRRERIDADQLARVVEEHVADAPAEDHAEHRVEREIGKLIRR